MVRAGRNDIGVYLDLASSLARDDVAPVTQQIGSALAFTAEYIVKPAEVQRFQDWVRERFTPELNALGLPGNAADSDETQARRAALLSLIGVTGNSTDVQQRARTLAVKYVEDRQSLPATLASTVLSVAAFGGDAMLYDLFLAQLPKLSGQPEEYYRFFNALSWFRDPALVQRTLQFAVSPDVRTQDTGQLIGGLLSHAWSREAAWAFVRTRWDTLTQLLGTFQGIPGIVRTLGNFCSREKASEIREFFAAHPVPAVERTLRQSLERIENCAAVAERQSPAASMWLASATH
jgi:aminopeptidase N